MPESSSATQPRSEATTGGIPPHRDLLERIVALTAITGERLFCADPEILREALYRRLAPVDADAVDRWLDLLVEEGAIRLEVVPGVRVPRRAVGYLLGTRP